MYYFVLGNGWWLSRELASSGQTTDDVIGLDLNCTDRDSEVCLCFCFLLKSPVLARTLLTDSRVDV